VTRTWVIIMVSNARVIAYCPGKWYIERAGTWEWGGEAPSHSLKHHVPRAGTSAIREFSEEASILWICSPPAMRTTSDEPGDAHAAVDATSSAVRQGYLLVTIGEKPTVGARP
jgi:hypothetical protein